MNTYYPFGSYGAIHDDTTHYTYCNVQTAVIQGDIGGVREFLEAGFDANYNLNTQWNHVYDPPLIFFAKTPEMLEVLVGHGANINTTDIEGCTALHEALKSHLNGVELIRALVRLGVDTTIRSIYDMTAADVGEELITFTMHGHPLNLQRRLNMDAYEAELTRPDHQVAFAMGLHPRLGDGSRVPDLEPEILQMILDRI
jgi:hypothetical protein